MSRGRNAPCAADEHSFQAGLSLCPGEAVYVLKCMQVVTFALFSGMIIR